MMTRVRSTAEGKGNTKECTRNQQKIKLYIHLNIQTYTYILYVQCVGVVAHRSCTKTNKVLVFIMWATLLSKNCATLRL